MKKICLVPGIILLMVIISNPELTAQNNHDMSVEKMNDKDTARLHAGMEENMNMQNISHAYSLNLPMSRNGSGTGWLPDESPVYGVMFHTEKWMYMLHGNLFLRYNNQDFTHKGSRGDKKLDAPDWLMFMGQKQVRENGLFHFSTMFSLDAVFGGSGYPLLFQSGETYNGKPLVDRQHPHDLFSELSISYSYSLSKNIDLFGYLGYPGEPALGPVAFMHRPSAMFNPDAPISHHWIDATHITFGVATVGIRYGQFKIEGSSFTGREPNEFRFGFDKPVFDSRSVRLSFNPSQNLALQVSNGFLKSPEELHPNEDINRTTASASFSKTFSGDHYLDAVVIWGINAIKGHKGENAFLFEASWKIRKLAIYERYEFVQKSAEELVLVKTFGETVFPVNAVTAGINYDILKLGKLALAGGTQIALYNSDRRLDALYGRNPMALEIFIRLFPSIMKM